MPKPRTLPRPFEMHWGRGEVVEEASCVGPYHEACIQLMQYTQGEAAGGWSIRFCSYNHRGAFQRSPLMIGEEELEGLRQSLSANARLKQLLTRLVS